MLGLGERPGQIKSIAHRATQSHKHTLLFVKVVLYGFKLHNDKTLNAALTGTYWNRYTALGGVFHGGIEVNGKEWSYGYCENGSGVYHCIPRDNPMYAYRESVTLGATTRSPAEVSLMRILPLNFSSSEHSRACTPEWNMQVDRLILQLKDNW